MSQRAKRSGAAPRERRRPASSRSGFWRWLDHVSLWFGVVVLALSFVVLAFPTVLSARQVLSGEAAGAGALLVLGAFVAAEVVTVLMIVLAAYAAAPDRLRLAPGTVRVLGTLSFGGMFFLILLVLRGERYAAVPVLVYFLSIRRRLAEQLPVFAGGRLQPQRKEARREDVVRRPPRSWDEPAGGGGSKAGAKGTRAGGKTAQSGGAGRRRSKKSRHAGGSGNRPKGR